MVLCPRSNVHITERKMLTGIKKHLTGFYIFDNLLTIESFKKIFRKGDLFMAKLSKAELVAKVAEAVDLSKAVAEKALNAVIDTITSALKKGHDVALVGFGTFTVSKRKARKGRNPQDGSVVNIPAKKVPRFKPGKSLKEAVNK